MRPLAKRDIPGLDSASLKSVSIGMVEEAYNLVDEVEQGDKSASFVNFVLAQMLAEPRKTAEEVAGFPPDTITALVEAAAEVMGIRPQFDRTSADLAPRERLYQAFSEHLRALSDRMRGPISWMLSHHVAQHVFIRCPKCGHQYPISDPTLKTADLYECYQQRRGKQCWVQCDQVLPQEMAEAIRWSAGTDRACRHRFTLHEGLVEYKAERPLVWFSRGPYTLVEEGVVDVKIGQAVQPDLQVDFGWIDFVEVLPRRGTSNVSVRSHWRKVGRERNRFEILTSAEHEEDIGKPVGLSWSVVGLKRFPEDQDLELWKRFLVSSARTLLYEFNAKMSILESWMAFELFLDEFIKDKWKPPHRKDNLAYLHNVAGRSTATDVRLVLHEALGIPFVGSDVWQDWEWTRAFRNQVAHGGDSKDTKYAEYGRSKRNIGKKFNSVQEIAKFCYRSVVRAIYFVRYWDADSSVDQQAA